MTADAGSGRGAAARLGFSPAAAFATRRTFPFAVALARRVDLGAGPFRAVAFFFVDRGADPRRCFAKPVASSTHAAPGNAVAACRASFGRQK